MAKRQPHRPSDKPRKNAAPKVGLRPQAEVHRQTRRAHAQEIAEDYCELIAELTSGDGKARVTGLAERLGVSHVTVVRAVARLARNGLVTNRPYRSIFLTEAGRALADHSRRRHEIVLRFLMAIGVSRDAAEFDAEGIEHHVCTETLAALERFVANGPSALPK